ncbi:MAG: helix-turn-helix domain-containing protein [Holosporaceae bacterium]|jgi:DNA-binding XRE family transcriptional regulator|nr:helix-turn-helix domain-containing protein [Holosporaceae bacterium]
MKKNLNNEIPNDTNITKNEKVANILDIAVMEIRSLIIELARKDMEEFMKNNSSINFDGNDINQVIGNNIRHARKFRSMTQHQLANLLGLTFQQLQKYETGKNRVSAERLYQLSRLLNIPIDYFFSNAVS